jgi:hypothetical protein
MPCPCDTCQLEYCGPDCPEFFSGLDLYSPEEIVKRWEELANG